MSLLVNSADIVNCKNTTVTVAVVVVYLFVRMNQDSALFLLSLPGQNLQTQTFNTYLKLMLAV